MFIDINTLGPEGLSFDRVLHLRGLDGPSRERLDDVETRVTGSVVPRDPGKAGLTARLEASVLLQCSRCLERFAWPVRASFDLIVVRAPLAADDSEFAAPDGKLDVEAMATEQLYLTMPLKPICSEGCRGLCPTCGANRNLNPCSCPDESADPRLAPLLRFHPRKTAES